MLPISPDFRDLAACFVARDVRYLVVGAHAVAVHGHPRFTGDTDVWIDSTPDNAARAIQALADFGFASLPLTAEDLSTPDLVVQLGYPPNRIDLLTSLTGVSFADCFPARVLVAVGSLELPVIGRDCLRTNKRAVGRHQDLADLDALGDDPVDPV